MTTITSLVGTDGITTANSMTKINTNFANLNTDKIETSALDTDNTLSANSDAKIPSQKAVKAYVDAGGNVNASDTVKGIVEEATTAEVLAKTATGATGARLYINPSSLSTLLKFGGTGADGTLSISTGTTTIDCANAAILVKNYSSISITGTGKLAFSNPHANGTIIILKCSGNCTITSSTSPAIDVTGMGAAGGAGGNAGSNVGSGGGGGASIINSGVTGVAGSNGTNSSPGNKGIGIYSCTGGVATAGATPGAGGTAYNVDYLLSASRYGKFFVMMPGAGGSGGGGGQTSSTGGAGGRGGGALYIEVAGAYNVTSTLSVAGNIGGTETGNFSGGGGGGGAGTMVILYGSLTADSGTYTISGGAGRTAASGANGGAGGAGASLIALNTEFI
ncbi:MAG: hypothetical protein V4469_04370 [Patescibacteria group bacterium]